MLVRFCTETRVYSKRKILHFFTKMNEARNAKKKQYFAEKNFAKNIFVKISHFAKIFSQKPGVEAVFCLFWWIFAKMLPSFVIPNYFTKFSRNDFSISLQTLSLNKTKILIFREDHYMLLRPAKLSFYI